MRITSVSLWLGVAANRMNYRSAILVAVLACQTRKEEQQCATPEKLECPAAAECPASTQQGTATLRVVNVYASTVSFNEKDGTTQTSVPARTTVTVPLVLNAKTKRTQTYSFHATARLADGSTQDTTDNVEVELAEGETTTLVLSSTSSAEHRISMNVTTPKQTQGATFGEKVAQGLHAAGSAVSQGASLAIDTNGDCTPDYGDLTALKANVSVSDGNGSVCGTTTHFFVRPTTVSVDAVPFLAFDGDSPEMAWVTPSAAPGQELAITRALQDAYILNANLPSGSTLSVRLGDTVVADAVAPGSLTRISAAQRALGGATLTARTASNVSTSFPIAPVGAEVLTGPCRPPYLCDFLAVAPTLFVFGAPRGAPEAINLQVLQLPPEGVLATHTLESTRQLSACFTIGNNDDTCALGDTPVLAVSSVSSLAGSGGGAAAASYARQGAPAVMHPLKADPVGITTRLRLRETASGSTGPLAAFTWDADQGLNGKGFAVFTPSSTAEPGAPSYSVLFVDASATPWQVRREIIQQ